MIVIPNTLVKEHKHGEDIEVNLSTILTETKITISHAKILMPRGIIGFEHITEYNIELLEGEIIHKLEGSVNNSPVFYLINPYLVTQSYTLAVRDEEYEILDSPDFKDIIVFAILTLKEKVEETSCNLLGPIVLNNINGKALQIINDSDDWGTKHLLSNGKKVIDLIFCED